MLQLETTARSRMLQGKTCNIKLNQTFPALDFFCGSGLVTEGLKQNFSVIWANDISPTKARIYSANHFSPKFELGPLEQVNGKNLPYAILSWGSFPCQDLSLAGSKQGIENTRSGLVWHWLRVMDEMPSQPPIIVAENVLGLISANGGENYLRIHAALVKRNYKVGAVVLDARHWLPQSRSRVFIIAVQKNLPLGAEIADGPLWCHPASVQRIALQAENWLWWRLPKPNSISLTLEDLIDFNEPCHPNEVSNNFIRLIPKRHFFQLSQERSFMQRVFPGYRRTRKSGQCFELRFDGIAGCLRTPQGGSSRQLLLIRSNNGMQTRLLTVKELSHLMGVPNGYHLPGSYNQVYEALGDAVAVPVVSFLAEHLLDPLARSFTKLSNDSNS